MARTWVALSSCTGGALTDSGIGGAADGLVGHQMTETLGTGLFGVDLQGKQRRAVEHLRVAQDGDLFCRQALPQAELFQQVLGGMS